MFKKAVIAATALFMAVALCGCGNAGAGNGEKIEPDSSVLIAYFSWSGHTRQVAEEIRVQTGGELFEIVPAVPYTDNVNLLSGQASQELRENARPALASHVENFNEYQIIFIGYPNWWSNAPMPVFTFLEEYDFSGKKLIPFTVYGESGFGNSIASIKKSAPKATVLEGYSVQEHSMQNVSSQVRSWLTKLGFCA